MIRNCRDVVMFVLELKPRSSRSADQPKGHKEQLH